MESDRVLRSQTFCREALTSEGPICIEHVVPLEGRIHPYCKVVQWVEAYLCTERVVGNTAYGTLCFANTNPDKRHFTEADKDFIMLMARWIEEELEQQQAEKALLENHELLNVVVEEITNALFEKDLQA